MNSELIRQNFIDFFVKKHGHKEIPGVSLIPDNDSTLLFTNSGMFPLVPYLLGEKHPEGKRLVNYQRCFRTGDIEEIGDQRHTTFFEMLGNWSLGDYFKKEQLEFWFEFLFEELKLNPNNIYQSVFAGDERAPKDQETIEILQKIFHKYGISNGIGKDTVGKGEYGCGEQINFEKERIFAYKDKNWWERGNTIGEVGGPDTETFYDTGKPHNPKFGKHCHINCDCGRFIEIGNSVFIQYVLTQKGREQLNNKNVDFGGGLERIVMIKNGLNNIFETDLFSDYIKLIENETGMKYSDNPKLFEIIADHIRSAVFIMMDGGIPSNKDQGYFIRRLLRRILVQIHKLNIDLNFIITLAGKVIEKMSNTYPKLSTNREIIIENIKIEIQSFSKTLNRGLKYFNQITEGKKIIDGTDLFVLQATYGFPIEIIKELANEKGMLLDEEGFLIKTQEHKNISKIGSDKKFKSGLADNSQETTIFHTTTHLLHKALKEVLGEHIQQRGSNITGERLRFDFSHPEKLSDEQKSLIENKINNRIKNSFKVLCEEMELSKALKQGAIGIFTDKYELKVKVYTIIDEKGNIISKEICGGPHIENSNNLKTFKIQKEEASSAGIRRIKGIYI